MRNENRKPIDFGILAEVLLANGSEVKVSFSKLERVNRRKLLYG